MARRPAAGCCTVGVRPGESIQSAIDSLPPSGGCVCLKTGVHVITQPLQITRSNVSKLQVAWTFPTGDNNKYFFNPVVVDGVMYVLAKSNSIVALAQQTLVDERREGVEIGVADGFGGFERATPAEDREPTKQVLLRR